MCKYCNEVSRKRLAEITKLDNFKFIGVDLASIPDQTAYWIIGKGKPASQEASQRVNAEWSRLRYGFGILRPFSM